MADNKNAGNTKKTGRKDTLADARDAAFDRARSAVEGLEANPVGLLVGGVAVGLIAGALVPRSDRERTALRPVGKRLAEGAVAAFAAAKETGREQLSTATLSTNSAKEGARAVFDSAVSAVKDSASQAKASTQATSASPQTNGSSAA